MEPEADFFAKGLGPDGVHLTMEPGITELIVEDRRLMSKLLLQGKDKFTVRDVANLTHNPPGTSGSESRKRLPARCV